jgi:hypothetical protein
MERFFDGMDQKNSKTQGGKGQIMKIPKIKKERMEERKRRDFIFFDVGGGSHTRVFSIGWEHPRATLPQENPLVWGPHLQQKTHPPAPPLPSMQMLSQPPKMPGPLGR